MSDFTVATICTEQPANWAISSISLSNNDDGTTTMTLQLETRGLTHLVRLMAVLEAVRGVISVNRINAPAAAPAAKKPAVEKPRRRVRLRHTSQN